MELPVESSELVGTQYTPEANYVSLGQVNKDHIEVMAMFLVLFLNDRVHYVLALLNI